MRLVGIAGLEPASPKTGDFKSPVSANSTTAADKITDSLQSVTLLLNALLDHHNVYTDHILRVHLNTALIS